MKANRRSLKVLHVDPERAWGGGEGQVLGLVSHLSSWGHENHLLCHPEGPLWRKAVGKGIVSLPVKIANDLDLRPILSLRRLIRREKYDVVHFHTKRAHALSLCLGRIHSGLRYVVTRRMDYPVRENWYNHYLYNQRVDGIVAISQRIADILAEGGIQKQKIRLIHSGIETGPFQKMPARGMYSGIPAVGTVAVLEERKGHRFLLEAAALLKQEGHRLIYRFAGEGSQREELQRLALELGLREEVSFLGFDSDIPGFLSTIDIFVLPSLFEGLGVAVLEAMAAAKPVIATRVGGMPELVEESVSGLLVPPKNAQALAGAIYELVSSEDLARPMGVRGRERVQRHFTMEQMAKRNEEYYYELLEDHPAHGAEKEGGQRSCRTE